MIFCLIRSSKTCLRSPDFPAIVRSKSYWVMTSLLTTATIRSTTFACNNSGKKRKTKREIFRFIIFPLAVLCELQFSLSPSTLHTNFERVPFLLYQPFSRVSPPLPHQTLTVQPHASPKLGKYGNRKES